MLTGSTLTINRIMDRAGRHRRLAIGFVLLAVPVFLMGAGFLLTPRHVVFAFCHFGAAASFLWVASQLVRRGSFVDDRGLPHAGVAGLFASVILLRLTAPDELTEVLGARIALVAGFLVLAIAIIALVAADRRPDPLIGLVGRGLLVIGSAATGSVQFIRALNGLDGYPGYSIGLASIGALLLAMSAFEGRLLWLALQLASVRHDERRND